ncbi:MAG: glutathione S-transferase [Candidatus Azotimanducaceae bacterium]|jgi:glutathione S-transferase
MAIIKNPENPIVEALEGLHLFHYDGAPCAQRVRFALGEKGLVRGREERFDDGRPSACVAESGAWVSRTVSLPKKEHMSPAYAGIHANLVVPALVHDGVLHVESVDIIEYLDEAFGGDLLVPRQDAARYAEVEMLTSLAEVLHRSIRFVTFRWGLGSLGKLNAKEEAQLRGLVQQGGDGEKLVEFYEGYDSGTITDAVYFAHLGELADGFTEIESRLADGRLFLSGDTVTVADALWAMKVMRLDECGYPFTELYPQVSEWFQRVSQRASFRTGVMGHHHIWHRVFKTKAAVESALGIGLKKVVLASQPRRIVS